MSVLKKIIGNYTSEEIMSLLKQIIRNYTPAGMVPLIFSEAANAVIGKTCSTLNLLRRTKMDSLRSLRFPNPFDASEQYCLAAESKEDWEMIRKFKKYFKTGELFVVSSQNTLAMQGRGVTVIPYDGIVENNFRTVVIPTSVGEVTIESKLRKLNQDTGHLFSIWDPHNYLKTSLILLGQVKVSADGFVPHRYGNIELYVSMGNIILPSYYANWGYVNYLLANEIKDGMSVLDMWAGSGSLGFFCKSRSNISISFSDINYFAILSMKMTMEKNPALKGKVWLSDVFENIPETEKLDLIIGNPPCGRSIFTNFINIGGADNEWISHISFFTNVPRYLKENGKICIVENICNIKKHSVEFVENFYRNFDEVYPELTLVDIKPLPGTFLSIITIVKR